MLVQAEMPSPASPGAHRFVSFPDLRQRFGIRWSRMHVDREEKAGRFPRRVKVAPNSVAWIEAEIIAWQERLIAERDRRGAA